MELDLLFSDGMVLQANKPVKIFGKGNGKVSVEFCGKKFFGSSIDGKWLVDIGINAYGGPYDLFVAMEDKKVLIKDVFFGDVYLLAGQSNMAFKMADFVRECLPDAPADRDNWELDSNIRCFVLRAVGWDEHFTPEDGWVKADNKENIDYISEIGYFVALNIRKKTGRTIGLISCAQGASVIQSWLPEKFAVKPEYYVPIEKKGYDHKHPQYTWNKDGLLYNAVFSQTWGYTFSHVIWYQGESNTGDMESMVYADMLVDLISCWRSDLNDLDLPFIVVQIADWVERNDDGWHRVQTAQATVAKRLKNVLTVISKDVCDTFNIHPADKRILSKRIANLIE